MIVITIEHHIFPDELNMFSLYQAAAWRGRRSAINVWFGDSIGRRQQTRLAGRVPTLASGSSNKLTDDDSCDKSNYTLCYGFWVSKFNVG